MMSSVIGALKTFKLTSTKYRKADKLDELFYSASGYKLEEICLGIFKLRYSWFIISR